MAATSEDLRAKRKRIVEEHVDSENRHEYEETIETFDHPRYEIVATDETFDGADGVRRYFSEIRAAFPDQQIELVTMHEAGDAIVCEVIVRGTHLGNYRGLPPTGRPSSFRMAAFFLFEEDRLVCERLYFDVSTVLRQLGIARDPLSLTGRIATLANHPLTVSRAVLRQLTGKGAPGSR